MRKAVHFYMDDSGTRTIDHESTPFDANQPNHFALGGVLVMEEDEGALRVYPERSAPDAERRIRQYYTSLVMEGLPFDATKSQIYAPLQVHEFNETLIELRFKTKLSPPMQIADLYLWPIAMHGYGRGGRPYAAFANAGRLIESHFRREQIAARATKYSCFELVNQGARNHKGPDLHPSL